MAFTATAAFEVRTTGNAANGGAFDPNVGAAPLSPVDLACSVGSTTVTSATGGFSAAHVGHILYISSGNNFIPDIIPYILLLYLILIHLITIYLITIR